MATIRDQKTTAPIGVWQELFVSELPERVKKARARVVRTPEICLEHARAEMKVFEKHPKEPRIIQRALIFDTYLRSKTIFIQEDELIVGNVTSKVRASPIGGELYARFLNEELDHPEKDFSVRDANRHILHPEERKELREVIIPYFKGGTLQDYLYSIVDEETMEKGFVMTASCPHIAGFSDILVQKDAGHMMINYEKVLHTGLKGIKEEAERYLAELDKPYMHFHLQPRRDFYRSVIISLDAAMAYAKRYADLARKDMATEVSPRRKAELEEIARVCDWVPANPARNWRDAVQTVWFLQCLLWCEQVQYANSFGRFDQYMFPFYRKSVTDEKSMSREEALELLECFWVKTNEVTGLYNYHTAQVSGGFGTSQNLLVGGQTPDGQEACNEVTMLCLEAEMQIGLPQPEIAMRVWQETPHAYLKKAAEVVRLGRGKMKFYADRTSIEMMKKAYPNYSIEDHRDYAVIGCVEICLPHVTMQHSFSGLFNTAKALDLTLNNGKCGICGLQTGPQTGDPRTFQSIEAFKDAFKKQTASSMNYMLRAITYEMMAQADRMPCPFSSALLEGPLQKGVDVIQGGAWWTKYGVMLGGLADTADSLTAIDKLIYQDKKVDWDELLTALKANWNGYENLRQLCLNDVPKYGNDNDQADEMAAFVMNTWYDVIDWANTEKNLLPPFGGEFSGSILIGNGAVGFGRNTMALPNGRMHPNPLADTMSPVQGADKNGPTAVIKSVSKMPSHRFCMGTALNQRLSPQLVATDRELDRFVAFLRTCEELGVYHIQFNVVTSDYLRKAMENPEKYRDLTVRVASYVAYFSELSRDSQLDIINRTEQQGW